MHDERKNKHKKEEEAPKNAIPGYLIGRQQTTSAKVLSNTIKQKRKEKAGKWNVPLPKVRGIPEDEMMKTIKTGKKYCLVALSLFTDLRKEERKSGKE